MTVNSFKLKCEGYVTLPYRDDMGGKLYLVYTQSDGFEWTDEKIIAGKFSEDEIEPNIRPFLEIDDESIEVAKCTKQIEAIIRGVHIEFMKFNDTQNKQKSTTVFNNSHVISRYRDITATVGNVDFLIDVGRTVLTCMEGLANRGVLIKTIIEEKCDNELYKLLMIDR